jgi:predicted DNA-binding antitoxin AbrB/MazE fold protein
MDETIQAVFENGVLRPLVPLHLREHEVVSLSIVSTPAPDTAGPIDRITDDEKQAIIALLDQMERMPERSPADSFSHCDHDRVIYGLTK